MMQLNNGLTVIHPEAKIGKNSQIHPFTFIDEDVTIGDNCWIGSNVNILKGARIGDNVQIHAGATLSGIPQDLKFRGEKTELIVGNGTIIRECCTLNRGTSESFRTIIGENCLLMAYVHVAHDCVVGNHAILANATQLAGHVLVGDWAILGGMTAVHQFAHIGRHSIVGGGSLVRKDVPPYVTAAREPLAYAGINSVGLERRGFSREDMLHIEDIYRILFTKGLSIKKAIEIIETEIEATTYRQEIIDFVKSAEKRGIMKGLSAKKTTRSTPTNMAV